MLVAYGFDAWVGEEFRPGNLVLVTPDGEARVVAEDLAGPNGTVILRNRALLVVAETRGRKLTAFDVAADGALSGRRVYADLGEHMPDGICLDEGGGIWVASFRGGVSCASSKAGPSAIVSTSPDAWRSPVSWAARMAARSFVSPVRALGRMFAPAARGRLSKSRKSMSPGRAHREVGQTALESLISIGMGLLGWELVACRGYTPWRALAGSPLESGGLAKFKQIVEGFPLHCGSGAIDGRCSHRPRGSEASARIGHRLGACPSNHHDLALTREKRVLGVDAPTMLEHRQASTTRQSLLSGQPEGPRFQDLGRRRPPLAQGAGGTPPTPELQHRGVRGSRGRPPHCISRGTPPVAPGPS